MKCESKFLPPPNPQKGRFWFQVSNGVSNQAVAVGIPIGFNATLEALGSKGLPEDELTRVAKAWLDSRLEKGDCDPFGRPETDTGIDVPLGVLDYWRENRSIPNWL